MRVWFKFSENIFPFIFPRSEVPSWSLSGAGRRTALESSASPKPRPPARHSEPPSERHPEAAEWKTKQKCSTHFKQTLSHKVSSNGVGKSGQFLHQDDDQLRHLTAFKVQLFRIMKCDVQCKLQN